MILSATLALCLQASVFLDDEPAPPAPTSRWGAAAGTSFRLGVGRGVSSAIGPRYGLRQPPPDGLYVTPAVAALLEGEAGVERGNGSFGAVARFEFLVAPPGGLLAPWFVAWVSAGGGAAWFAGAPTGQVHVGVGLGGNAFADGGAWGAGFSWADWMEGITWPVVLFATLVGLPLAMAHVELRYTYYPALGVGFPSVLLGMGM